MRPRVITYKIRGSIRPLAYWSISFFRQTVSLKAIRSKVSTTTTFPPHCPYLWRHHNNTSVTEALLLTYYHAHYERIIDRFRPSSLKYTRNWHFVFNRDSVTCFVSWSVRLSVRQSVGNNVNGWFMTFGQCCFWPIAGDSSFLYPALFSPLFILGSWKGFSRELE